MYGCMDNSVFSATPPIVKTTFTASLFKQTAYPSGHVILNSRLSFKIKSIWKCQLNIWYQECILTERRHEWKKGINIPENKTSLWSTLQGLARVNPSYREKYLDSFAFTVTIFPPNRNLTHVEACRTESSNNSPYGEKPTGFSRGAKPAQVARKEH